MRRPVPMLLVASLAVAIAGCAGERSPDGGPLVVFNAGSLARPIRAALDSFTAREGVRYEQESAGSLETARKLTELGKVPDLIALADAEVFPGYLVPTHVTRYVEFARNRMVLAYTARYSELEAALATVLALAVTYAILWYGEPLRRQMGSLALGMIGRLSGAFVVVIALELGVDGVRSV